MDFEGNLERIIASIRIAKEKEARYRLGPELEITGYGCEDGFLEEDTFLHSWECLGEILKGDLTDEILCDIGMPILHKNVRYNCRILVLNRKILLIRPKLVLAADGNYREPRWFAPWQQARTVTDYYLPRMIREITGQDTVPFGDAAIATRDTSLAPETSMWVSISLPAVTDLPRRRRSLSVTIRLKKRSPLVPRAGYGITSDAPVRRDISYPFPGVQIVPPLPCWSD
jgi:hypothetical protein